MEAAVEMMWKMEIMETMKIMANMEIMATIEIWATMILIAALEHMATMENMAKMEIMETMEIMEMMSTISKIKFKGSSMEAATPVTPLQNVSLAKRQEFGTKINKTLLQNVSPAKGWSGARVLVDTSAFDV